MKRSLILLFLLSAFFLHAQAEDRGLFREAESRLENGDYLLALELYQNITRTYPLSSYIPDSQFRIAQCSYYLGKYSDALAQLDRTAHRYAGTRFISVVPFWRGMSLYRLERYPEAVAAFSEYLKSGRDESRSEALLLEP